MYNKYYKNDLSRLGITYYESLVGQYVNYKYTRWGSFHVDSWNPETKLFCLSQGKESFYSTPFNIIATINNAFMFRVRDYTTILFGRYDETKDCYYVQRGDGTKYEYASYRVIWKQKLIVNIDIN